MQKKLETVLVKMVKLWCSNYMQHHIFVNNLQNVIFTQVTKFEKPTFSEEKKQELMQWAKDATEG